MDVSDLETTSNSDEEPGAPSTRSKVAGRKDRSRRSLRRSRRGNYDEDFAPEDGEVEYGAWTKTECFKVEKGLMTFGYANLFFQVSLSNSSSFKLFSKEIRVLLVWW